MHCNGPPSDDNGAHVWGSSLAQSSGLTKSNRLWVRVESAKSAAPATHALRRVKARECKYLDGFLRFLAFRLCDASF